MIAQRVGNPTDDQVSSLAALTNFFSIVSPLLPIRVGRARESRKTRSALAHEQGLRHEAQAALVKSEEEREKQVT